MKILYFTDVNVDRISGVLNKINSQIEYWVQHHCEVCFISLENYKSGEKILLTESVKDVRIFKSPYLNRFLGEGAKYGFLNKIVNTIRLRNEIKKLKPDVIYIREMLPFPCMSMVFPKSIPVILESNTLLKEELKLYKSAAKMIYKLFSKKLYRRCNAVVGVTNEIRDQFKEVIQKRITISNGIDLERFKHFVPKDNGAIDIVFVGSPDQPWHGVDKYYKMAKELPEFNFHLIGPTIDNNLPNLFVHGYLDSKRLFEVYKIMNIAVGSLAIHRNNMKEACPLKVREYLGLGLPIIIGYDDVELMGKDYVLALAPVEDSIASNVDRIRTFIIKNHNNRVDRSDIEPIISSSVKEKERLVFFKEILSN